MHIQEITTQLNQFTQKDWEELLTQYYRKHPLTKKKGFYRKALPLIQDHEHDFAAVFGQDPNCTLFVEGGEVVVEDKTPHRSIPMVCTVDCPTILDMMRSRKPFING